MGTAVGFYFLYTEMVSKTNKNRLKYMVIISLIAAVLAVGLFGYYYVHNYLYTQQKTLFNLFSEIESSRSSKVKVQLKRARYHPNEFGWVVGEGYAITVPTDIGLLITTDKKSLCSDDARKWKEGEKMIQQFAEDYIHNTLFPLFKKYGYRESVKNAIVVADAKKSWGFFKGDDICQISTVTSCGMSDDEADIEVDCSSEIQAMYAAQQPILKDLTYTGGEMIGTEPYKSSSTSNSTTWQWRNVHSVHYMSGHYVLIKKENGKWTEIIEAQDDLDCGFVRNEKIPSSVVSICVENVPHTDEYVRKLNTWNIDVGY